MLERHHQILALRRDGKRICEIARALRVSRPFVSMVLKRKENVVLGVPLTWTSKDYLQMDRRFKDAMRKAIRERSEAPLIGVATAKPRLIRPLRPEPSHSGCSSAAAW